MTCQINPPKSGRNGRCAGVFLRDSSGAVYLGHTGKLGGGGVGIGRTAFLKFYDKPLKEVTWPDGTVKPAIVIGKLSSPSFMTGLAEFVYTVDRFKEKVKGQSIVKQLERDATQADRQGEFKPRNVEQSREKVVREINLRRGQPEFRKVLLSAYGGRCAICRFDCADALEAAHIRPYGGEETNHVQNGLLLRSDFHTLFDLGKIGIDPDTRTIIVAKSLLNTSYGQLAGQPVHRPVKRTQWPNDQVLREHLKRWGLR